MAASDGTTAAPAAQLAAAKHWYEQGQQARAAGKLRFPAPVDDRVLPQYEPQTYANMGWAGEPFAFRGPAAPLQLDPQVAEAVSALQDLMNAALQARLPAFQQQLAEWRKPTPEELQRWEGSKEKVQSARTFTQTFEKILSAIPIANLGVAAWRLVKGAIIDPAERAQYGKSTDEMQDEILKYKPRWERPVTDRDLALALDDVYRYRGFVSFGFSAPFGIIDVLPADPGPRADWQKKVDAFRNAIDDALTQLGQKLGGAVYPYFPLSKRSAQLPPEQRAIDAEPAGAADRIEPLYFAAPLFEFLASGVMPAPANSPAPRPPAPPRSTRPRSGFLR